MKALENLAKQNPLMLAGAAVLVIAALYWFTRQAVKDTAAGVTAVGGAVADTIAGVATGDNAITQSAVNADGVPVTAYEGAGILGTVGAATNAVSGGYLATAGEKLGGWVYDLLHSDEG